MYIAVNVGNTEILMGLMDEKRIVFTSRLHTDRHITADEYAVVIRELLFIHHVSVKSLEGGIVSSVVPQLQSVLCEAIEEIIGRAPVVVGPGLKSGLKIRIDDPGQLGPGQVAYAVAATAEYPMPAIILELSTATTISVLDKEGAYRGGMIIPGVAVSMEALSSKTSQLPQIGLPGKRPKVIATNTVEAMRSGILYGTAAALDGVIDLLNEELGEPAFVLAIGRLEKEIIPYCRHDIVCDQDLILKGLAIIYEKNRKQDRMNG